MPVIGFVSRASAKGHELHMSAFLKGLSEVGYVDGRDLVIEFHWPDGRADRPAMVADLVRRQVAEIVATTTEMALAAAAIVTSRQFTVMHQWVAGASISDAVAVGQWTPLSQRPPPCTVTMLLAVLSTSAATSSENERKLLCTSVIDHSSACV